MAPLEEARDGVEERPVLVIDLGGQYSQLIARRIRECRVYSELVPFATGVEAVRARRPRALVLSGGPASVYADGAPRIDPALYELGVPTLGICYGMQLMALDLRRSRRAHGRVRVRAHRAAGVRRRPLRRAAPGARPSG